MPRSLRPRQQGHRQQGSRQKRAQQRSCNGKHMFAVLASSAVPMTTKNAMMAVSVHDLGVYAAWDDQGELCGIVDDGCTGGLAST